MTLESTFFRLPEISLLKNGELPKGTGRLRGMIHALTVLLCGHAYLPQIQLEPVVKTAGVRVDADDPAFWQRGGVTRIIGTDKGLSPNGGLFSFDAQGRLMGRVPNLSRPNNVDVAYGLVAGKERWDLAVATERDKNRLLVCRIMPDGTLVDVTGKTSVFVGEKGDFAAPMGVAVYSPKQGRVEAVVSPKDGPKTQHLGRYELVFNQGKVDARLISRLGVFSGKGETEAIAVHPGLGVAFHADEEFGIHAVDLASGKNLVSFGRTEYPGDREGMAVWGHYLFSSDQRPREDGGSIVRVYDISNTRKGVVRPVLDIITQADSTDGLDVFPGRIDANFPNGALAVMNSRDKNFWLFDLRPILRQLGRVKSLD